MSTFDERESAFENKFAHDAEMQFKAEARRNKLLGLWAAELLGKSGDDAESSSHADAWLTGLAGEPRGAHLADALPHGEQGAHR